MPDVPRDRIADTLITQAVGEELRRVREHRGWTRSAVVDRMYPGLSVQALANYEYGTRPCTVARFVKLCAALEVSPADVLGLAMQRAVAEWHGGIQVDLHAVVRDRRVELRPLRRWARRRLADDPNGSGVARIDRTILKEMAALLGFSKSEFVQHLVTFTPESAPPR